MPQGMVVLVEMEPQAPMAVPVLRLAVISPCLHTEAAVGQVVMITPTLMVGAGVEQEVLACLLELVAILLSKAQRLVTR